MRITVYDVLSYLASGMTTEEILADFPYLTQTDILAYLAYAADREQKTLATTFPVSAIASAGVAIARSISGTVHPETGILTIAWSDRRV